MMQGNLSRPHALPDWLPDAVRLYLDHTEDGLSLRALARRDGCHASTVLRTVRRYEKRREDPLMDAALDALARQGRRTRDPNPQEQPPMTAALRPHPTSVDEIMLKREGLRVLRRLTEPGATLAIAPDMEKAVVMRDLPDGRCARLAVVDRAVAQGFVLQDWIAIRKAGRVSSYEISAAGRAALRRLIDEDDQARLASGLAEAPMAFADQHRIWGEKLVDGEDGPRRVRHNLAESPVTVLGRRREKDGRPFLEPAFVEAAERLREDFELAQMGPRVAQNWERFLTGGDRGGFSSDAGLSQGPRVARDRVAAALRDLGPGLGDVALRVCCFLEGIEATEQRMGWAARSGKIVLRIALQRLRRHYDEAYGKHGPLIG
jgi:lambda repressor-like predicted transcriptional regulator/DNA-binding PadR family transcriptional regulator